MTNPYHIEGPALVSFSGGRTSGYMLRQILDAHDGKLPDDVHVCFANTGKEREETLRFVHECETRWGVRVHWLQWKNREGRKTPAADRFDQVGLNSAARSGEPMKALIERKKYLPNATMRFCTSDLKIDTMKQFMLSLGFRKWDNIIGLRADEVHRIVKSQKRNEEGKERWTNCWPMLKASVTRRDVWRFWLGGNVDPKSLTEALPQGFDLGLYPYEGNCDGCFLKGREVLMWQERERPGYLDDWAAMEARASVLASKASGARFVTEYSYADMKRDVGRQPLLVPLDWRNIEFDAECGVSGTDRSIRCGKKAA